jgi:hypothetical protein
MQFDFKKARIDILAIIGFALLALIYCYPQLQGKKLSQHDNLSWQGMAHEAMAYYDSTGKDVLWSNSMFGGMPTYTTYVGTSNVNYLSNVQTILQLVGKPAYFFFIAMLGFYVLMRVLKINKWLGMIGAVAYAFSTYNPIIISVGHDTKMLTLGYLPVALAGLYLIFKDKWIAGATLFGVASTLMFVNNHFQVIYYALIMFGCFALCMLYMAIKEGKIKQFLISAVIAGATFAASVGTALPSIIPTAEYSKETMRGGASELSGHDKKTSGGLDKEYAFRWSNGIGETFCLMIPYLYGGSSGEPADKAPKTSEAIGGSAESLPLYWGPQPFISGPVYFGAVICFLFVLGLMVVRSGHKWWILAASLICIVLSWGKNFEGVNFFLFDHLPFLNKFRTPTMALVIPEFLFPLLGLWGVHVVLSKRKGFNVGSDAAEDVPVKAAKQEVIEGEVKKEAPKPANRLITATGPSAGQTETAKQVMIAAGITAGLCLLLGPGGSMFFNFTGGADAQLQPELVKLLREDRASLAATSGFKSAVFILLAAGLLWAYLKDKINAGIVMIGLGVLIAIDLIPMASNYLNSTNYVEAAEYETALEPREVDRMILQDKDPYYRVLDLSRDTYNDAIQAYFHKCVGGYHPAKMETYQDLIDRQMSRGFNGEVLNMLNTKYIIAGRKGSPPQVIPNPTACGNAWFVNEVKWANTADEEMDALNAPELMDTTVMPGAFNARKTAVMRATFKNELGNKTFGKDSAAYVKLARYGLDEISFTSSNSQDGLAVFSDIYYNKGWKAYVDGKETPIMKANYVLRSIWIPKGQHSIEFRFHPESFYQAKTISMISSILLVGLCLGALYMLFKKGKPGDA